MPSFKNVSLFRLLSLCNIIYLTTHYLIKIINKIPETLIVMKIFITILI